MRSSSLVINVREYKKPAPILRAGRQADDEERELAEERAEEEGQRIVNDGRPNCMRCYCLAADNPFTLSDLSWKTLIPKLVKALSLLILVYISFKLFIITFMKLRYDSILDVYQPKVIINGTIISPSPRCALPENIQTNLNKVYDDQYKDIRSWLEYLGDPIISIAGVGSIISCSFAMTSIFFFMGPYLYMFFLKYGAIIHNWSFLKEPLRMRDKIRYDLDGLCKKIKNTLKYGGNLFDANLTEELIKDEFNDTIDESESEQMNLRNWGFNDSDSDRDDISEFEASLNDNQRNKKDSVIVIDKPDNSPTKKQAPEKIVISLSNVESGCNDRNLFLPERRRSSFTIDFKLDQAIAETVNYDPIVDVAKKREKFATFIDIIIEIGTSNIMEPSNSTANYHKGSLVFYLIFTLWPVIQGLTLGFITLWFIISKEIGARIKHRLNMVNCEQELEGSIPIKNHIELKPFADFDDQMAYVNYDGSLESHLLVAYVEAKYLYTQPMVLVSLVEYSLIFYLSTYWIGLMANLFLSANSHSLVWLNQIESQVVYCIGLVESQIKSPEDATKVTPTPPPQTLNTRQRGVSSLSLSSAKSSPACSVNSSSPLIQVYEEDEKDAESFVGEQSEFASQNDSSSLVYKKPINLNGESVAEASSKFAIDDRELYRLIAITYLNFEMFRCQHRGQQKFMNFLLLLVVMNALISLYFCFIANKNIEPDYMRFLLIQASVMVLLMNLYLISGSLLTAKMLNLMKNVTRLVVSSNYKKKYCEHNILELWRRQCMTDGEIKKAYAASFLGIYVTFDKLITINSWLILLWMVLLFKAPEPAAQV